MTIHSWGAIAPDQNDLDKRIKYIRRCKPALNRWKTTKALIIDEGEHLGLYLEMWSEPETVSMVDGHLFDALSLIAQCLRKTQEPFGGIQVRLDRS